MQPEIRFLRLTRKQIRYKLTVTNGFMGCIKKEDDSNGFSNLNRNV